MTKTGKTFIGVSAVLLTLAVAAMAFAHGGGYGRGNGGGWGGPMMGSGPHMRGYSDTAELSAETRTQIDAARESFYQETRELRREIDDARIALRDEMRKDAPDNAKVIELQTVLSDLQAQFDQKRVSHRLEMRKLVPEDYRDRSDRGGRGFGRGFGCDFGRGGSGRGFGGGGCGR